MTKWSEQVSPDNALPEYPRPQMVRARWLNLNGLWEFSSAKEEETPPFGKTLAEQILVPYPVESPLSGLMRREDRMWYRRLFTIPPDWKEQRVLLHFGAVTWQTTVYVNGKEAGVHKGGYGAFAFDITDQLKPGENEVVLQVVNPSDLGNQPVGKQTRAPRGYWYTASSGIWQTVWLEPVPAAHITRLDMTPDVAGGKLRLTVLGEGIADQSIEAVVSTGGSENGRATGTVGKEIEISIPKARLWSPEDPFLYDIKVSLKKGDTVVDSVAGYFGMRSIVLGKVNGVMRPLLNGKFVFLLGQLDQGFWPDGNYTAPTDEALRFDIEEQKKMGYNVIRKHIKVEPARWYYWADKLGILVMQDMPSMPSRGLLPDLTEKKKIDEQTPETKKVFEGEFLEMINQLRSAPSIIAWIEFNEHWGQYSDKKEVGRLAEWVKNHDPSRLLIAETGAFDTSYGDALDWHTYPGPGSPPPTDTRMAGQGEFGGAGFVVKDHSWTPVNEDQETVDKFTARYVEMIDRVKELMYSPGLSYAIYTQITDVENERNGLYTYDRAVLKADLEKLRKANLDVIASSSRVLEPLTNSFRADFSGPSGEGTSQGGSWKAAGGALLSSSGISWAPTNFNNFSCEADLTLTPDGEAGLVFRAADGNAGTDRSPAYYAGLSTKTGLAVAYREADGWISLKAGAFPVENGKKIHLRLDVFGGTIRVYVDDMAVPKIEATDFRSLNGPVGLRVVKGETRFENFKVDNPFVRIRPLMADNRFLSHDSRQKDLVRFDDNVNRTDDALWRIAPGLSEAKGISLESARNPGFYLRDLNGKIGYEKNDGSPEFAKQATWIVKPGLADPQLISYEALAQPGEYLRMKDKQLFRLPVASPGEKNDATFMEMR